MVVDLADQQAIDAATSSYQAHLDACAAALAAAEAAQAGGGHALVVLDEPGADTDPAQGAAVAQATVEALLGTRAARLVVSTHSHTLKAFALGDRRLNVGAMATAADGTPTYELVLGAVGDSLCCAPPSAAGCRRRSWRARGSYFLTEAQEGGDLAREMEALVGALVEARGRAREEARRRASKRRARRRRARRRARRRSRRRRRSARRGRGWAGGGGSSTRWSIGCVPTAPTRRSCWETRRTPCG